MTKKEIDEMLDFYKVMDDFEDDTTCEEGIVDLIPATLEDAINIGRTLEYPSSDDITAENGRIIANDWYFVANYVYRDYVEALEELEDDRATKLAERYYNYSGVCQEIYWKYCERWELIESLQGLSQGIDDFYFEDDVEICDESLKILDDCAVQFSDLLYVEYSKKTMNNLKEIADRFKKCLTTIDNPCDLEEVLKNMQDFIRLTEKAQESIRLAEEEEKNYE